MKYDLEVFYPEVKESPSRIPGALTLCPLHGCRGIGLLLFF
jgi:hypothetical protein